MIGSHADIRPHHYRMARQQSYSMREAHLVSLKPLRAWWPDLAAGVCLFVVFAIVAVM